jgi:hypothetical protein
MLMAWSFGAPVSVGFVEGMAIDARGLPMPIMTTARHHIDHVVCLRPKAKMGRVTARRIVTGVQDGNAANCSVRMRQPIGYTMRRFARSSIAVPVFIERASPQPTFDGGPAIYASVKVFDAGH